MILGLANTVQPAILGNHWLLVQALLPRFMPKVFDNFPQYRMTADQINYGTQVIFLGGHGVLTLAEHLMVLKKSETHMVGGCYNALAFDKLVDQRFEMTQPRGAARAHMYEVRLGNLTVKKVFVISLFELTLRYLREGIPPGEGEEDLPQDPPGNDHDKEGNMRTALDSVLE